MTKSIMDQYSFPDGYKMPIEGFGVYKLDDQKIMNAAINQAIDSGYRLFDTAQAYANETMLGKALKQTNVPRSELFITTKVAEKNQGYDETLASFDDSLQRLDTDYVDLLLVHWPIHSSFFATWRAFEHLKQEGTVREIGVSNFHQTHLDYLATQANEMPVVNQIENHPYLSQEALVSYGKTNHIITQAWSPLGRGTVLKDPVIGQLATKYAKTPAQIILRWHLQRGLSFIPKSKNPARIAQNAAIYDFTLSDVDMTSLNQLNKNQRTGDDPELVYELEHQYH
ncbi:aldo/keto reductase [Loigolactobacillus backii]|uniref:aldo/keto reductase n=1 Tax=Loigolactobacillus backii TaxID=375175 RepID=UPI000C1CC0E1|nr:aldo/keto reductase [Loigolactobacillus backii]PIO83109.1 aldo/keto reductase [Loigolactobacillus backii]